MSLHAKLTTSDSQRYPWGYSCESGIAIFAWRDTWNSAYSLFKNMFELMFYSECRIYCWLGKLWYLISDRCITKVCLSDLCITKVCISKRCITKVCFLIDALQRFCIYFWSMHHKGLYLFLIDALQMYLFRSDALQRFFFYFWSKHHAQRFKIISDRWITKGCISDW